MANLNLAFLELAALGHGEAYKGNVCGFHGTLVLRQIDMKKVSVVDLENRWQIRLYIIY